MKATMGNYSSSAEEHLIDRDQAADLAPGKHSIAEEQQPAPQLYGWAGWTPFFLQKRALVGFMVFEAFLILGLIALAVADSKEYGITSANSNAHYLWTYGPTAILAILAALWGKVEHRTKQALPWHILRSAPSDAPRTLLLDYVTTTTLEAFFGSLRSSYWHVSASIVGSFLIKLLIVASTGLLSLQNTHITNYECHIPTSDDFVSSFNSSKVGSVGILSALASQDGILAQTPFTTTTAAYQSLSAPNTSLADATNWELQGAVRSFHGGLDCDVATITSYDGHCSDLQCHGLGVYVDIDSPSCSVQKLEILGACSSGLGYSDCDFGNALAFQCGNGSLQENPDHLLFLEGHMSQNLGEDPMMISIWSNETTTLVCTPTYNISNALIRVDSQGNLIGNASAADGNASTSAPFPAWDLMEGLRTAVEASGMALDYAYAYSSVYSEPWNFIYTLFQNYTLIAYPNANLKDEAVLQSATNDFIAWSTAQMVKESLMQPATGQISGICEYTIPRLRVGQLSVYLMVSLLTVLILITASLWLTAPRGFVSRDPGSIGGLALSLSESPSLLSALSHDGASEDNNIRQHLQGLAVQSTVQWKDQCPQFSVQLSENPLASSSQKDVPGRQGDGQASWWHSASLSLLSKGLTVTGLLLLIVILEVLQWKSDQAGGLVQVNLQSYARFAWVYIPTMVMLGMQVAAGSIAFSSIFIFPYYKLCRQPKSSVDDLFLDYTSHTALESAWNSIRRRHLPVLLMSLLLLASPFLTIAASGLYTAQPTSTVQEVSLSPTSQFNSSFKMEDLFYADFETASIRIGLLLTQNFSYPAWTYDELTFPALEVTQPINQSISGSYITTMLPALRSDLKCSIVPDNPTNYTALMNGADNETFAGFTDVGCTNMGWAPPGLSPFGFFSVAGVGLDSVDYTIACGAYGTSEVNWVAFTCQFGIYQVNADVTLDASTLAITSAEVDETSSKFFSNQTISQSYETYPSFLIPSIYGSANFAGETAGFFDPAFQAVIYDSGATRDVADFDMAGYMGESGFNQIVASLQHIYRNVVAQSAGVIIRTPYDSNAAFAPPATTSGVLTNPNVYRLRQSPVSTRFLDAILAFMALCIVLSSLLMDARKVVPNNPASIAGAASLLAGSANMLQTGILPEGAQWWSDEEIKQRGLWRGWSFKLGWWNWEWLGVDGPHVGRRYGLDALKTSTTTRDIEMIDISGGEHPPAYYET
ncbi:hypothetical protein BX600DRAFT_496688 [Xylariales sp. PMI_506]|nr:hypothetical protein BX600DRAFT_496688 [Xylariales sp. PMI_506]